MDTDTPSIFSGHDRGPSLLDRAELAAHLFRSLPGEHAEPVGDSTPGWEPEPGRCHDNVARWLSQHSEDRAVRGWLHVPYVAPPGYARFYSHSVVLTPTGRLLDVSLAPHDGRHEFVRHPGPEGEFLTAVANNGMPLIDHQL